ncbi:MAG: hypothetical protein LBG72_01240 [Spirochaetaceae bacterium]|jgi:hypothetical protein|nr:hypothetical protein [Spirochaetaceae bacterium]
MKKPLFVILAAAALTAASCVLFLQEEKRILSAVQEGHNSLRVIYEGSISIMDINIEGTSMSHLIMSHNYETSNGKNSYYIKVTPYFRRGETITVRASGAEGSASFTATDYY